MVIVPSSGLCDRRRSLGHPLAVVELLVVDQVHGLPLLGQGLACLDVGHVREDETAQFPIETLVPHEQGEAFLLMMAAPLEAVRPVARVSAFAFPDQLVRHPVTSSGSLMRARTERAQKIAATALGAEELGPVGIADRWWIHWHAPAWDGHG